MDACDDVPQVAFVVVMIRSELDDHLLRSTCPAGVCTPIAVGAGATAAGAR